MNAQRRDLAAFGGGIADLFAGRDSDEAEAASWNLAQIFTALGSINVKGW